MLIAAAEVAPALMLAPGANVRAGGVSLVLNPGGYTAVLAGEMGENVRYGNRGDEAGDFEGVGALVDAGEDDDGGGTGDDDLGTGVGDRVRTDTTSLRNLLACVCFSSS